MLVGKNLVLRPLKIEDLEKTHVWRNDLELIKMTQGIRFPKTLEMDKDWFDSALNDKSNRNIYFGIDVKETNEFIGIIQLNNIDYISGTANWGFIIGENAHQGKGYGLEAPNLFFKYAFDVLNLRKISSYNIHFNAKSLKMQQKIAGIKEEGRLKSHCFFDGEYHDIIILSLFKKDFINEK